MELNKIYQGDCLSILPSFPPKSIDMILCDLPYGTTACKWDTIIPFEPLWEQYKRIIKDNGAIVLTASQPFTSALVMSNIKWFKYEWIWDKKIPSGMSYARFQPMRQHENIVVFCNGKTIYNPQMIKRDKPIKRGGGKVDETNMIPKPAYLKGKIYNYKNPTTIQTFIKERERAFHPTQKPVALFEYLIKTYTNEGDLVLDNCAGSGTTGVAAKRLKRNFILIEKEEKYCKIAEKRIREVNELF